MYSRFEKKHILFLLCFLVLALAPFQTHAQSSAPGVQLYWEASSYTPPFYKGKALPPSDDTVVVTAITPASFGDSASLIYTWKMNGVVFGSLSGTGKSSLTLSGSPFVVDRLITVTVRNAEKTQEATGVVKIPVVKPRVVLYEDEPLRGLRFEKALDSMQQKTETDIGLVAYPFFFSELSQRRGLLYRWTVNGQAVEDVPHDGTIIARSDTTGTSTVSVSAESPSHILQRASESITIFLQ